MVGHRRGRGAPRRAPLVRARLLRTGQQLLSTLGRDKSRPRPVPGMARGDRCVSGAPEADDLMTVSAARQLTDRTVCFVGIGLPSTAANLARLTHAPRTVLVYESGTIGSKPSALPLSIGDGELAETADAVVSVPEIFNYWLQGCRIDVGFLGAAQIDPHGNLNSTVIGDYDRPKVRLPGGGGAPEIAAMAKEVIVIIRQSERTFVERLDFRSSVPATGEMVVITD